MGDWAGSAKAGIAVGASLLALATAGCNGRTIQATNSDNQTVPACGGCVYTKADNPVLTGRAPVAVENGTVEEAIRNDDQSWRFSHFQLTLGVTGGDAGKGSMNEGYDYAGPVPWPSQRGDWVPTAGNPLEFPWEAHGIRVGYANLTVNAQKQDAVYNTTVPILGTVLKLDPKTILVPIQVAQLVPDYSDAPRANYTADWDKPGNEVLFDDRWGVAIQKDSASGGIFDHITGTFAPKADESSTPPEFQGQVQPDNVFRPCGIQFRLVAFRTVRVPKNIWEMLDDNGNPVCAATQMQDSRLGDAYQLAVDAGLDASLPIVMYTDRIGVSCSVAGTILESTCGYNYCVRYFAAIATPELQSGAENSSPYILSHELGHILGLDDLDQYNPNCTDGNPGPLMCPAASEIGPGFTTGTQGSCATARIGAAFFSNEYFGTSPDP